MNVGRVLRNLRKSKGMTQLEVAKRAGLTNVFLSQIERGHREASIATVGKLASALGISVDLFLLLTIEPEGIPELREIIDGLQRSAIRNLIRD